VSVIALVKEVGFSLPLVTILAKRREKITRENGFELYGKWFSMILRCFLCSLTHNPISPILPHQKASSYHLKTRKEDSKMKRNYSLCLIALFCSLLFTSQAFSMGLYDDFSAPFIDTNKWRWGEWVREVDPGSGKLVSAIASPNAGEITGPGFTVNNFMNFKNPNTVDSIQADVSILETYLLNAGHTRVSLGGNWFWDGTTGGGFTGDIWAEISLRQLPAGLVAQWSIIRYYNPAGDSDTLGWGHFETEIVLGDTYTLFIGYDSRRNRFTFRINGEEVTFGRGDGLPRREDDARNPSKYLRTRVWHDDSTTRGYVYATFDEVFKNGVLYDDFSVPVIDATKWAPYEFVREVSDGEFRSKIRSSSASVGALSSQLDFVNPSGIQDFQAKVTPLVFENLEGVDVAGSLAGFFFNDGDPEGGLGKFTGEVGGAIYIGGTGESPVAYWKVWRFKSNSSEDTELLAEGTFITPITMNETYTLSLGWDGKKFTFKIGDEVAKYRPVGSINPSNRPWKAIRTRISNPAGQEAAIEFLFDDVKVNYSKIKDILR